MERVQTPEGKPFWKMVDPYTYRDRLSIPKLLINGSNDRYWTLNALDLYWGGLKGPKYLVELPNTGHGLEVNRDWAINGLGAFFRQTVSNRPLPALSWGLVASSPAWSAMCTFGYTVQVIQHLRVQGEVSPGNVPFFRLNQIDPDEAGVTLRQARIRAPSG